VKEAKIDTHEKITEAEIVQAGAAILKENSKSKESHQSLIQRESI